MSESTPEPVAPDGNVFVPALDLTPVVETHVPVYNQETGAFE